MPDERLPEPKISIEQVPLAPASTAGTCRLTWEIRNLCAEPLTILAARLPHSQFRSAEQEFSPGHKVFPNQSAQLECAVECPGEPGIMIENAFLILRVLWLDKSWRLFARLRVTFDDAGAPHSITENVTTQQIGFSHDL